MSILCRHCFIISSTLLTCVSCLTESELNIEIPEAKLSINGILHPDSLIRLEVNKITSLSEKYFETVTGLEIELYENDEFLAILNSIGNGVYTTNYAPLKGLKYSIKTTYDNVEYYAEDVIPDQQLTFDISSVEDVRNTNAIRINLNVSPGEYNEDVHHWFNFLFDEFECGFPDRSINIFQFTYDTTRLNSQRGYPQSSSLLFDRFNAFFDNTNGLYEYDYGLIRLDEIAYGNQQDITIQLYENLCKPDFKVNGLQEGIVVSLFEVSRHFDSYLKSLTLQLINTAGNDAKNEEALDNIFISPIKVYSNVKNGTGIFAAYNTYQVKIKYDYQMGFYY